MDGISIQAQSPGDAPHRCVLKVHGYVDTSTANELQSALEDHLQQGHHDLLVDLADVDYVSSAGWGIFINIVRSAREAGGDLCLIGMQPEVQEVFELLEFRSILDSYPTIEDALELSSLH